MAAAQPPHIGTAMPKADAELVALDITAAFELTDAARQCVAKVRDGAFVAEDLANSLYQELGVAASVVGATAETSASARGTFDLRPWQAGRHEVKPVELSLACSVSLADTADLLGLAVNATLVGSAATKKITGHNITEESIVAVAPTGLQNNLLLTCMAAANDAAKGVPAVITAPADLGSFTNPDGAPRARMRLTLAADSVLDMAAAGYRLAAELLAGQSLLPPEALEIWQKEMPDVDFAAVEELAEITGAQARQQMHGSEAEKETLQLAAAVVALALMYDASFRGQESDKHTMANYAAMVHNTFDPEQRAIADAKGHADQAEPVATQAEQADQAEQVATLLDAFIQPGTAKRMDIASDTAADVVAMPYANAPNGKTVAFCMDTAHAVSARDQSIADVYTAFAAAVASCPAVDHWTRHKSTAQLADLFVKAVERQTKLNAAIVDAVHSATQDPAAAGYVPPSVAYDYDRAEALDDALHAAEMRYDDTYANFALKVYERMCCPNVMSYVYDKDVRTEQEAKLLADQAEAAGQPRDQGFVEGDRAALCEQPMKVPLGGWGNGAVGGDCENAAKACCATHAAHCQTTLQDRRRGLRPHHVGMAHQIRTNAQSKTATLLRNAVVRVAQASAVGTCLCTVRGAQIADASSDQPQPVGLHMVAWRTGLGRLFQIARDGKRDAGMQFAEQALNSPNFHAHRADQLKDATWYDLHLGVHPPDVLADILRTQYNRRHNPSAVPGIQFLEGTGPAMTGTVSDVACDTCNTDNTSTAVALQRRMLRAVAKDKYAAVSDATRARLGLPPPDQAARNQNIFLAACSTNTAPVSEVALAAAQKALELDQDAGDFYKHALTFFVRPQLGARIATHIDPDTAQLRGIDPAFLAALNDPDTALAVVDTFHVGTRHTDSRTGEQRTRRGANIGWAAAAPGGPDAPRDLAAWPNAKLSPQLVDNNARQLYSQHLDPNPPRNSKLAQVGNTDFRKAIKQMHDDAKPTAGQSALADDDTAVAKHFVATAAVSQDRRAMDLVTAELKAMTERYGSKHFAVTAVEPLEPPGTAHAAGFVFRVHASQKVLSDTHGLKENLDHIAQIANDSRDTQIANELKQRATNPNENTAHINAQRASRRAQHKAAAHADPRRRAASAWRDAANLAPTTHNAHDDGRANAIGDTAALLDTLDTRAAAVAHAVARAGARTSRPREAWMTAWVAAAAPIAHAAPNEVNIAGVTFMCTHRARAVLACFHQQNTYAETGITTHALAEACDMDQLEIDDLAVTALLTDPAEKAYVKLFDEVGANHIALTAHALRLLERRSKDNVPLEAVW